MKCWKKEFPGMGMRLRIFQGATIGEVTSGTQSPSLDKAIGMGYVRDTFSNLDAKIYIKIRDKLLTGPCRQTSVSYLNAGCRRMACRSFSTTDLARIAAEAEGSSIESIFK